MKTTLEEKLKCVHLHSTEGVPIFEIERVYNLKSALHHFLLLV